MRTKYAPATFVGDEKIEYIPGRWLRKGDRVRISGGPVWVDGNGARHRMGERGVFVFDCAAVDSHGVPYIIVSGRSGATVCIPLVARESRLGVPGWKNEPYRVRRCRKQSRRPK